MPWLACPCGASYSNVFLLFTTHILKGMYTLSPCAVQASLTACESGAAAGRLRSRRLQAQNNRWQAQARRWQPGGRRRQAPWWPPQAGTRRPGSPNNCARKPSVLRLLPLLLAHLGQVLQVAPKPGPTPPFEELSLELPIEYVPSQGRLNVFPGLCHANHRRLVRAPHKRLGLANHKKPTLPPLLQWWWRWWWWWWQHGRSSTAAQIHEGMHRQQHTCLSAKNTYIYIENMVVKFIYVNMH